MCHTLQSQDIVEMVVDGVVRLQSSFKRGVKSTMSMSLGEANVFFGSSQHETCSVEEAQLREGTLEELRKSFHDEEAEDKKQFDDLTQLLPPQAPAEAKDSKEARRMMTGLKSIKKKSRKAQRLKDRELLGIKDQLPTRMKRKRFKALEDGSVHSPPSRESK